jgi:Spy/CpxP family protein refolding chaperone
MKRIAILAIAALLAACSSTDPGEPGYAPRNRPPMEGDGGLAAKRPVAGGLDMLPPAQWWHQPMIAGAVKLTNDQMQALDKIGSDQSDEIARIDRDTMVAVRDVRQLLDSNQPASADIITAGQRLRDLRNSIFDRQLQMLAAERTVLSLDQWQTLQAQLQQRRTQRNQDNYPRRGGRGGTGGRGRWPGF